MHIAFFTETYFPQINGVTYTVDSWREELENRGHTVSVVYPESDHTPAKNDVPVSSFKFKPVDGYNIGFSFLSDLSERMPEKEVDIVHAHGPFSLGILGARFARYHDAPFVMSYHTPGEQYFDYVSQNRFVQELMDGIYLGWERLFYRRCDLILSPTTKAGERLQQRIGRAVQTVSNGINTDFFSPATADAVEQFKQKHDIPLGTTVIGYCGRLGYEKNLEDLVELASLFEGEIVVAGEGFAEDYYRPMFEDAGVRYIGCLDREEMPVFHSMLDVFIIPSTAETQGISVLEANACGTPAIGADAQALQETIQEGVNGYRYTVGDIDALHARVLTVMDEDLSETARCWAQEHSIETVIDALEEQYDALQR